MYTPLNGNELADVIAADIAKKLKECDDFGIAITHPKVSYSLELVITSYPKFETVKVSTHRKIDTGAPVEGEPKSQSVKLGRALEAPDKEREDIGLIIPQRQTLPSGEIADLTPAQMPRST